MTILTEGPFPQCGTHIIHQLVTKYDYSNVVKIYKINIVLFCCISNYMTMLHEYYSSNSDNEDYNIEYITHTNYVSHHTHL